MPTVTCHSTPCRARMRPPPVRALPRERLLRSLGGAADHRLVLITGPAGCGKTTLLAQYTSALTTPTAWYRVDAGDRREAACCHMGQALATVVPGLDRDAGAGWRSAPRPPTRWSGWRPSGWSSPSTTCTSWRARPRPRWASWSSWPRRGWCWPRRAARPRAGTCRGCVSGALREIAHDDLRFRSWEVERLFADVYGEPLPPGDVAQLARGLEGWAAGLQLFHLATRGKHTSERRRAVASLPARSKLIREYLSGNVLDELPEDERSFLVDTAVLGRLTPALCDDLREQVDWPGCWRSWRPGRCSSPGSTRARRVPLPRGVPGLPGDPAGRAGRREPGQGPGPAGGGAAGGRRLAGRRPAGLLLGGRLGVGGPGGRPAAPSWPTTRSRGSTGCRPVWWRRTRGS